MSKSIASGRPPLRRVYRRYYREFFPAILAYLVIMLLGWPYLGRIELPWLKALLALAPVIPVALVIRAMVRLVLGSDELEQRTHLVGLALAGAVVAITSLAGGFLCAAHVVQLDGSVLLWVFPVLMVSYAGGRSWANRRYGIDDNCEARVVRSWQILLGGATCVLVAALGWNSLRPFQVGMLIGMGGTFLVAAGVLAWRERRSGHDGD